MHKSSSVIGEEPRNDYCWHNVHLYSVALVRTFWIWISQHNAVKKIELSVFIRVNDIIYGHDLSLVNLFCSRFASRLALLVHFLSHVEFHLLFAIFHVLNLKFMSVFFSNSNFSRHSLMYYKMNIHSSFWSHSVLPSDTIFSTVARSEDSNVRQQ